MYAIYKYSLNRCSISAKVIKWLNIGFDPSGEPCVWAIVDTDDDAEKTSYLIFEIGTGWTKDKVEDFGTYLGTLNDGPYMWHYFVKEDKKEKYADNKDTEVNNALPPMDELDDFYNNVMRTIVGTKYRSGGTS